MKRHKQLWERICAFDNITDAAREAMLGKRGTVAGARFFADWEREVVRLERELREGSYRPGAYHYFQITDPKLRETGGQATFPFILVSAICSKPRALRQIRYPKQIPGRGGQHSAAAKVT